MSSQTPNIGLTLPTGSENVSRQIINENNTKIDTAIGGKAGQELLGYKENGNTASQAIADGSFVVWKGDLYKANGSISQGTAFSGSNLTAVPSGGFNDLQGQVNTLSDSIVKYLDTSITLSAELPANSSTGFDLAPLLPSGAIPISVIANDFALAGAEWTVMYYSGSYRMRVHTIVGAISAGTYSVRIMYI